MRAGRPVACLPRNPPEGAGPAKRLALPLDLRWRRRRCARRHPCSGPDKVLCAMAEDGSGYFSTTAQRRSAWCERNDEPPSGGEVSRGPGGPRKGTLRRDAVRWSFRRTCRTDPSCPPLLLRAPDRRAAPVLRSPRGRPAVRSPPAMWVSGDRGNVGVRDRRGCPGDPR